MIEYNVRKWIFVIFVFLSINSFGQDKKEIEEFINQIATQIVPKEFEYYNLLDTSIVIYHFDKIINTVSDQYKNTKINSLSIEEIDKLLESHYNQNLKDYRDFISQKNTIENDSLRVNWNDYNLQNAHIYSENNLPNKVLTASLKQSSIVRFSSYKKTEKAKNNLQSNELLVPMKHWWLVKPFVNRKCLFKIGDKKWQEYKQNLKDEDRTFYKISMPVFSENKQFAIISFVSYSGGKGGTYIFKKEENKWVRYHLLFIAYGFKREIVKD